MNSSIIDSETVTAAATAPLPAPLDPASAMIAPVESGRARFVLPAVVVGDIESVVAEPPNPRVRSAAISSLIEEIYRSTAWVHGADTEHPELVSLAQVLAAAYAHEARIAALDLEGAA